jgi:ABC-type sugar transport system substrate-binding protein
LSAERFEKRKAPRSLLLLALALVVAVVAVGCGSSDDDGTTANGGGGGDAAELEGKTVGYIDVFATAPIEKRFYNAFRTAAEHVGWDVQLQDAAGEQAKALTAARNFLNSGVDAIVTSSVPSEWLRPIVAEAKSKDVPLVELITKGTPGVYNGEVLEAAGKASSALADTVMEENPQGGEIGITYEPEIAAEVERLEGLEAAFEGTNIKIAEVKEVPQIEAPTTQKAVIDMLNANPDIAAFLTLSDIQTSYALAGLRSAGNSEGQVYSWYADSTNVELMKQNPQLIAVVDSDIAKVGWIATGELLGYFSGGELTPQIVVDPEPLIIRKAQLTPGMFKDEGPIPFAEIGAPFYADWESEFGIGG